MSFADVLDATLGGPVVTPPPRDVVSNRAITPPLLLFSMPGLSVRTTTRPVEPRVTAPRPAVVPQPAAPDTPLASNTSQPARARIVRPAPALSAEARRALDALNELGAGLGADVTVADARRAFRRLARRYHPDRHPGCDDAARIVLARRFATTAEHYRALTAALISTSR